MLDDVVNVGRREVYTPDSFTPVADELRRSRVLTEEIRPGEAIATHRARPNLLDEALRPAQADAGEFALRAEPQVVDRAGAASAPGLIERLEHDE